jgi:kumamolisin
MARSVSRRLWIASVAAVAIAAAAIAALTASARSVHSSRPAASAAGPPRPRYLGLTPSTAEIAVVLELKSDDAGLARYVEGLTNGHSPRSRHVLSRTALGRRFGAPMSAVRLVRRRLEAAGLRVTAAYPQRTAVEAFGTAAALGREFRVSLRDFVDASGVRFHAPSRAPTIPPRLRPWVTNVFGLDSRPRSRPADVRHGGGLVPSDAAVAYDALPLQKRGVDGRGLTIAIASHSTFSADDAAFFARYFGIRGPPPRAVPIAGVAPLDLTEAALDIDVVRGIAPGARVLVYEAPNSAAGELAMYDSILNGPARIVSYSWGLCDRGAVLGPYRSSVERRFLQAVAEGITVFVASGDAGAYECQRDNFADHRLTVSFPADSPDVVSVGGTLLDVRTDGGYFREAGWEDVLTNAGGGGGVSPVGRKPSWQSAFGVGAGTPRRAVPDVSAAASPGSAWWVRTRPAGGGASYWAPVGGTSAAAPFWAASMLLVQQWAQRQGAGRLCFAAPLLYAIAFTRRSAAAFHDVTRGGNRHYDARPGWDYATGLGSPDVWNLARAAAAYLKGHPGRC